MVVKNCEILPIEVVVRGYLTGRAWRDYQAGKAISGIKLPSGLKNSHRFDQPLMTPSTKAEKGEHDLPISEQALVSEGFVDSTLWSQVRSVAFDLFALGSKRAKEQGLLLVDTKYEFGLLNGKLILADEIHTMDSSRYWVADSYEQRYQAEQAPHMLDKEPVRQWLISQGYMGEGAPPAFSDQYRSQIALHYIDSYERITGSEFKARVEDTAQRMRVNLKG